MDANTVTNISNDLSTGSLSQAQGFNSSVAVRSQRNADVVTKVRDYVTQTTQLNQLVFPQDVPKYYMYLQYSKYNRTRPTEVNFTSIGSIALPLPTQGLVDQHDVDYEEKAVGVGVGTAWNTGTSVAQQFQNVDDLSSFVNAAGTAADAASKTIKGKLAATALENLGGAGNAGSALLGISPNQFLTILLKGPRYKRHEFTWKLVPRNNAESETIRKIIKELNNAMAPSLMLGGAMFGFPYVFWIGYMPNSKYLYKFKPAVLESCVFNYAPSGIPAFYHNTNGEDGNNPPESVEIRCRFLELEYWIRGQFGDSNDAFAGERRRLIADSVSTSDKPPRDKSSEGINGTGSDEQSAP